MTHTQMSFTSSREEIGIGIYHCGLNATPTATMMTLIRPVKAPHILDVYSAVHKSRNPWSRI